jgi:nucleoid-associated protein YgaU
MKVNFLKTLAVSLVVLLFIVACAGEMPPQSRPPAPPLGQGGNFGTLPEGQALPPVPGNSQQGGQPVLVTKFFSVTIQPHDSLWLIAKKYTGDARNWIIIAHWNNLDENSKLPVGGVVIIPDSLMLPSMKR